MTTDTADTEYEAKFEVDRDFDPPDLRDLIGGTERLPEQQLRTIYFDTPDRRLRERGITLRHRTTNEAGSQLEDQAWTLKMPEGSAGEFLERQELSWPGDCSEVPADALRILQGVLRRSNLGPVADLQTTRRRLLLGDQQHEGTWGELDDDLVKVVSGSREGTEFRQLEVELGVGESPLAASVIDCLRSSGAKPTSRSKASIALDEPGQSSIGYDAPETREREKISDTIRAAIGSALDRLLDHDFRLRIDPEHPDPHHVHQTRVATRRLRSDLKTFAPFLDPIWVAHTSDELAWIGSALGKVRDLDVISSVLAKAGDAAQLSRPETEGLNERLLADRARAAAKLANAINSRRYIDLLDRLHAAQQAPPIPADTTAAPGNRDRSPDLEASAVLPALVGERWRALRRKAAKAGTRADDAELHKIRIRAKRLRYAAETAAPILGKPARKTASNAEKLQDLLGELRDLRAASTWLRESSVQAKCSPRTAFAAGVAAGQLDASNQELRRQWRSGWKKLKRKKNLVSS